MREFISLEITSYSVSLSLSLSLKGCYFMVILWSESLATDPEVPGSIPGHYRKKSSGSGTGSTQPREYN
jgi:hypothetical protein